MIGTASRSLGLRKSSWDQLNASFLKRFAVQLASRAAEIVDANDLIGRVLIENSVCKAAADKAADTRD